MILVSATPLNNKPEDIANLVYLFQDSKDSTLEEGNLQRFFREHIDRYNKLKKQKDLTLIADEVKSIYERIRIKVVEPLTVRRTRTDLMEMMHIAKIWRNRTSTSLMSSLLERYIINWTQN